LRRRRAARAARPLSRGSEAAGPESARRIRGAAWRPSAVIFSQGPVGKE
jgi:hypothetical protein